MRLRILCIIIFFIIPEGLAETAVVKGVEGNSEKIEVYSKPAENRDECLNLVPGCKIVGTVEKGSIVTVKMHMHTGPHALPVIIIFGDRQEGHVPHAAFDFEHSEETCSIKGATQEQVGELVRVAEEAKKQDKPTSLPWWKKVEVVNKKCKLFIDSNAKIGEVGKKFLDRIKYHDAEYIKEEGKTCFHAERTWADICPGFTRFSQGKKDQFFANLFGELALDESSCNPNTYNPNGSTDRADGYFGLEYSAAKRKEGVRDPRYCPHTSVHSQALDFQINCTLSIIRDRVCKADNKINYNSGYWQELRYTVGGRRGTVYKAIKRFPGCEG